MSPREGMYYVGMILGMVGGVTFSRLMGWHHLIGLGCGIAVGFPLGIVFERMYARLTAKPGPTHEAVGGPAPSGASRNRSCDNPNCQWTGDPGASSICPRCGQSLRK